MTKVEGLGLISVDDRSELTFDDIFNESPLDYSVTSTPVKTVTEEGDEVELPRYKAMKNAKTDTYFADCMVGSDYGIVQNDDVFTLAKELRDNGAKVTGSNAFADGAIAVMLLKYPETVDLNQDTIQNEALVRTAHDGSGKVSVTNYPRMRATGLVYTLPGKAISFKHTKNAQQSVAYAARAMKKVSEEWATFTDSVQKMMSIKLSDTEAKDYIEMVFGDGDSTRAVNTRDKCYDLFKYGTTSVLPSCRDSLFGALTAIVDYCDNHKTVRASKKVNEETANFNAKTIGEAAKQKAQAFSVALILQKKKLGGFSR